MAAFFAAKGLGALVSLCAAVTPTVFGEAPVLMPASEVGFGRKALAVGADDDSASPPVPGCAECAANGFCFEGGIVDLPSCRAAS